MQIGSRNIQNRAVKSENPLAGNTPSWPTISNALFPPFLSKAESTRTSPIENGNVFARRAARARVLKKKSVPAGWPAKSHFGTIWGYRAWGGGGR